MPDTPRSNIHNITFVISFFPPLNHSLLTPHAAIITHPVRTAKKAIISTAVIAILINPPSKSPNAFPAVASPGSGSAVFLIHCQTNGIFVFNLISHSAHGALSTAKTVRGNILQTAIIAIKARLRSFSIINY